MTVDWNKTKDWALAAVVRAGKTMAETALGMVTVGSAFFDVDWAYIVSVCVVAGIMSMLWSIAGIPEVEDGKSLVKIEDE